MIPRFPRIELALKFTLEYFEIGRIADCIDRFGGGLNLSYLDTYYDITKSLHKQMEEEINQNRFGSNKNIQVSMFEFLKGWLRDWHFNSGYETYIEQLVNEYNEKAYTAYQLKIQEEEEKFKANANFNLAHLAEYEEEYKPTPFLIAWYSMSGQSRKKVNKWFYCNTEKSGLIDTDYLRQYFNLIKEISGNFTRIVNEYVSLYDAGKIVSSTDIIIEKQVLIEQKGEMKLLTAENPQPFKKLKVNLTVPQLAYLFKLLYDFNLLGVSSKSELKRFIIANISTKASEDISDKSLENKLSATEKAEANFWADKFMEMYKAAKKV